MPLATIILLTLAAYASLGVAAAVWILTRGLRRVDPVAGTGGLWFRLIIAPGVVALWPVLVMKATRRDATHAAPPGRPVPTSTDAETHA